jgi:hypothetical protein
LRSVTSRATFEAPVTRPELSRIGETRKGNVNAASVLGKAHRVEVLNPLAPPQARQDLYLFIVQFRRNNPQDWLPDHFARLPSEDATCTFVPRGDAAFQGLADDRIIRRGNDGGELC